MQQFLESHKVNRNQQPRCVAKRARLYSVLVVLGLLVAAGPVGLLSPAQADLISAWEFNDEDVSGSNVSLSGGTLSNDDGTGTLQDNATVTSGVLQTDGDGDYLQFGDIDEFEGQSYLAVSAWIQPDTPSEAGNLRIAESEDTFYLWQNADGVGWTVDGGSGSENQANVSNVLNDQEWTHVFAVFDGAATDGEELTLYINGGNKTTAANPQTTTKASSHTFQIAARDGGASGEDLERFFDGNMDDVGIWNAAPSADVDAFAADLAGVGKGGYEGRMTPTGTVIPEPSTLMILALCALFFRRRRR